MTYRFRAVKLAFVGLAAMVALSVAPAAGALGTPTLTDTGSSYWTVRANGSNFTPGGWVFVESIDRSTGAVSSSGWVVASSASCTWIYCFFGGNFSYYGAPNTQCGAGRDVWAYDWGTAANGYGWVGPLQVGCS
jgi:hypothetical protein